MSENSRGASPLRAAQAERAAARAQDLGPMPVGTSPISIRAPSSEVVQADLKKAADEAHAHQGALSGQARRAGRRRGAAGRGHRGLREPERHHGQARLLRRAALRRRHVRSRARQVLRRHPGEAHRHHDRPHLLRARAQPDRRGAAGARAAGAGARALQAVDRRPAQGEALPARREARAPVPREVDHRARRLEPAVQRDHDGAALRGGGRDGAAVARADAQFPDASRRAQAAGGGRGAGQGVQGQRPPLHADHQHARQGQGDLRPLARLQGRGRQPPSRQPRRARGGRCAGRSRARGLSAHRASLLRDEGQVARQGEARLLGPQRAAARQARARRALGGGAGDGARAPTAASRRTWRRSPSGSSTTRWIDAPVREGKAPGAFSHPTVPSVHPYVLHELPGQAARRDDARARARPRRAPGAGGAAGPAAGADAADAGRDGLRVRRDADLQGAARRRPRTPRSARRCSPRRSRT